MAARTFFWPPTGGRHASTRYQAPFLGFPSVPPRPEGRPARRRGRGRFRPFRREFFFRSVVRGHLTDRCFVGMVPDFPELGSPAIINDDEAVLAVAIAHLEHTLRLGEVRSGYLPGNSRARGAHLPSGPRCRAWYLR